MNKTKSTTASVLLEGAEIADGARNQTHGDKERSFTGIADAWNTYLYHKYNWGGITSEDVAWMNALQKMMRRVYGTPIRDHAVDAAVYSAITWELCERLTSESVPVPPTEDV